MAKALPTADKVWAIVRNFAKEREHDETKKVPTLARGVGNTIVYVDEVRIRRRSDEGTAQTADIMRSHVEGVWQQLVKQKRASTKGHDRVFTHALMYAALPQYIVKIDGSTIGLNSSTPPACDPDYSWGRGGGGEGPLHRALRLYILEDPNRALAHLEGGPWKEAKTEFPLATQDRIDVVLQDKKGQFTLIEVKPELVSDRKYRTLGGAQRRKAIAPFAQAAKYRTQWHILYGTPLEKIRCVVAAPAIPRKTLSVEMFDRFTIESIAIELPKNRKP